MQYHTPVLLQSAVALLHVQPGGRYLDATFGGGGHSSEIIRQGGQVLGLDQDQDALNQASARPVSQSSEKPSLTLVHTNFIHLAEVVTDHKWQPLMGVLFDLGVSQHQFTTASRGFSFQLPGPLDMRMDTSLPHTAATLVNSLPEKDLAKIFWEYGEEPHSRAIARKIILSRPINTTSELAKLMPQPDVRRRIFQALRITVNDELGSLQSALPQALEKLSPQGRLVVISFHSLEDRIVKQLFRNWQELGLGEILTPKPIVPAEEEQIQNPQSKSAKLRAFKKT